MPSIHSIIFNSYINNNSFCTRYYKDSKPEKNLVLNEVARLRIAIGASLD